MIDTRIERTSKENGQRYQLMYNSPREFSSDYSILNMETHAWINWELKDGKPVVKSKYERGTPTDQVKFPDDIIAELQEFHKKITEVWDLYNLIK